MEKATQEIVNKLSRYIEKPIIRRKNKNGYQYTLEDPIILKGFTDKGEIIYTYIPGTCAAHAFGLSQKILNICFTDEEWMLYENHSNM